jgi:hypothetical protein
MWYNFDDGLYNDGKGRESIGNRYLYIVIIDRFFGLGWISKCIDTESPLLLYITD